MTKKQNNQYKELTKIFSIMIKSYVNDDKTKYNECIEKIKEIVND